MLPPHSESVEELMDNGANRMAWGELVPDDDMLDGVTAVSYPYEDIVLTPSQLLKLTWIHIITQAAVSNTLSKSALLGWDIPQLRVLVGE